MSAIMFLRFFTVSNKIIGAIGLFVKLPHPMKPN